MFFDCLKLFLGFASINSRISALEAELAFVRNRTINYYRNRWDVIDNTADYLVNAELPGDYAEFGVFQGTTFGYCANLMGPLFPNMRFLAFDSFEGLPQPSGFDLHNDFSSGFFKGQFACSESEFQANVFRAAPNLAPERLHTIPGWFDQTLNERTADNLRIEKFACVWIDCDFYESTIPILNFLTPRLSVGTVILFDDWRCFHNLPDYGQQRACAEWLAREPQIKLNSFISFGFHGQSFTVGQC